MGAIPFMILLLSSCLFWAASSAFFFSSLSWSRVFTPPSPFRFSLTVTGLAVLHSVSTPITTESGTRSDTRFS